MLILSDFVDSCFLRRSSCLQRKYALIRGFDLVSIGVNSRSATLRACPELVEWGRLWFGVFFGIQAAATHILAMAIVIAMIIG